MNPLFSRQHKFLATRLTISIAALMVPAAAAPKPAEVVERTPLVELDEHPVEVRKNEDGVVLIDFGKAAFGYLELRFESSGNHGALSAWLGEKARDNGRVDRNPGATIRAQQIEVPAGDGPVATFEPTWSPLYDDWIENPPGVREIMPFRYVEIAGLDRVPETSEIVRVTRHTAWDGEASHFSSDHDVLNGVWDLCKYSIRVTTFLGLYVDGDRERKPYEADAYINQLCHYAVEDHYLTGRLTHEHLLRVPTWPMEWRQHSVMMAWMDYLYSGSDESIRRHYGDLAGRLMLDRRRPDGLFLGSNDGTPRDIIDWPVGERDGYDMSPRVKTVTSAFHAHSLMLMSRMAHDLGRREDAKRFSDMYVETARVMREKLMDPERGIYIDGLDHETGARSEHASLHANMIPLAFGLVAPEDIPKVAAFVKSRGMACSVYGSQYLLEGLYRAGEAQHALDLMTATHDRSWAHMHGEIGSTVTLEAWDRKYKPNLDWNHAWGAVPANIIPRKLMGIEPLEPGFSRIRVRPQTASLSEARVRHPTPRGPVDLAVVRGNAGSWRADLGVPRGAVAEVHVPAADAEDRIRATATDGTAGEPKRLRTENDRAVFEVAAGTWRFEVE